MALSHKERDRRGALKLYEKVDGFFDEVMEDKSFVQETVKAWALADPKGFMTLLEKRLPKVQNVDQDFLRMTLGLKSLLEPLVEVEDVSALVLKEIKARKTSDAECEKMTGEKEHWRRKYLKEHKKHE